jgi:lysozyme family protein
LALTQAQAEQILYERYWLVSGADQLPADLAAVHGDTAINLGLRAANELLAQSGGDPNIYLDLRDERYRSIAAANPDKTNYLSVWLRRNDDLRSLINSEADLLIDRPSYAERLSQRRISTLATSDPDY